MQNITITSKQSALLAELVFNLCRQVTLTLYQDSHRLVRNMIDPSLDTIQSYNGKPSYSPAKYNNATTTPSSVFKGNLEPPWKDYAAAEEQSQVSGKETPIFDPKAQTKPYGET
ncbi:hypothetical protein N7G274_010388 [Stereocaulon virgatum]|uniref:Uncharacterized protein n=1 Tax=Stereocaulon virgatum TaxID=373712 RepID=A0ABR3ZTL2_9LECA